jgi:hypothetical protein
MSDSGQDHDQAAAGAAAGAENVVPGTTGSGTSDNPHIEAFKSYVAGKPELQEQLAASTSDEHFAEQAVTLGAAQGHAFTADDVRSHIADSRSRGFAAAFDDPEQAPASTSQNCGTGYTHVGSCSWNIYGDCKSQ